MELLVSALLGDLASRSINFIINKCSKPPELTLEENLQRALLRPQVIIDEAMGRHITNQAMIIQLDMLRDVMHRGYYMLDTYVCRPYNEEEAKDQVMRRSLPSIGNSAKRLSLYHGGDQALKEFQVMLNNLSSMLIDVKELVLFLTSYPRLCRQPYSMHLLLANCMFGRQMEAQLVINFLLHPQSHSVEELEVLPIVGPGQVGKSTLVAHICKDERLCAHFSEILLFHIQEFTDDEVAAFRNRCEIKRQNIVSGSNLEGRFLIVIELIGDLNEDAWSRLYSACKQYAPRGSKIIVTSRFQNIVKYGTTQALTLKFLSHEAFWYFFRTLTFGSMDPKMHPRHAHLAMEIARTQRRSHIGANIIARFLRDNFNLHFWCKVLAFLRGFYLKHFSRFAEHPFDLPNQNSSVLIMRMTPSSEEIVLYYRYRQCFSEEEVPKINFQDLIYGSVNLHGKVEALAWRSEIPPYYSYVYTCEIQETKTRAVKRKRFMQSGGTNC